jgi:hypothetical protein
MIDRITMILTESAAKIRGNPKRLSSNFFYRDAKVRSRIRSKLFQGG